MCNNKAFTTPKFLAVQMADDVTLTRGEKVGNIQYYYVESSNFLMDTELFSDRPMQLENSTSTDEWFNNFEEIFNDGLGAPNAALTIVDNDMSQDNKIMI